MLNNVLDRIGEYNPQLMREIKSRVSWRNVIIMAFVSFVSQLMVLIGQSSKLPLMETKQKYYNDQYCFYLPNAGSYGSNCKLDAAGLPIVDWLKWWSDTTFGLSVVMAVGLFAGGVYLLASNFSQEERRGTLNFIRLTPQQASSVIGGKLAGVPLLVYMGTALALPLQFHAVQQAHLPKSNTLGWDILMSSLAILLYIGAILATMWFKAQSILLAGIAMSLSYPLVYTSSMWYNQSNSRYGNSAGIDRYINWYGLHVGNNFFSYLLLTGLTSTGIYWLYQAIQRRYLKPTATVLSKKQSYLWSAMYHAGMAGFAVFGWNSVKLPLGLNSDYMVAPITVLFSFGWLMLLIPLLLPSQQSLVEWSRQRPVGNKKRSLWADLIGHEKSPAMLAIALNIAIAAAVWLPLILLGNHGREMPKLLVGISLTTALAVIYSTITHWVLFWKVNQRYAWMVGIVGVLVFLPPIFGMVLSAGGGDKYNIPLLFSPFLWGSIAKTSGFTSVIVLLLLASIAAGLNVRLWRGLNKVGRSESFKNFKAKSA
jgi:hypothetical protein